MKPPPPPLYPCIFQLPLKYDKDHEVEPEVMGEIFMALDRQFGGWTNLGTMEGSWHGEVEHSIWVKVAVPKHDIDRLKAVVKAIGKRLRQKQMYFEEGQPTAELIDVDDSTDESSQPKVPNVH